MPFVELLPSALAIVALLIAVWQTRLALKSQREATEQAANLERIEASLTTRYRGEFPSFVKDVAEVLGRAEGKIDIFCDLPGYAEFSDHIGALKIRQAVEERRASGIQVEAVFYSDRKRREVIAEQYAFRREQWREWIGSPSVGPKVVRFLSRYGYEDEPTDLSIERYVEISSDIQRRILDQAFGDTEVGIGEHIPLYFWVADEREAIFAIPSYDEDAGEHGFYTSDSRIIHALLRMRSRYLGRIGPG